MFLINALGQSKVCLFFLSSSWEVDKRSWDYINHQSWDAGALGTFIGSSVILPTFLVYFRISINQFLYKALIKLLYQLALEAWHLLLKGTLCQKIAHLLVNTTPQGLLAMSWRRKEYRQTVTTTVQVAVVATHTGMQLPGRAGQAYFWGDRKVQI